MSKLIAMLIGAWSCYCTQMGDYSGAMFILLVYGLIMLGLHIDNKKSDSTANTDASNK